jgi:hypothetical protein
MHSGPVEIFGGNASVFDDFHKLKVLQLSIGVDFGFLKVQAHAFFRLFF